MQQKYTIFPILPDGKQTIFSEPIYFFKMLLKHDYFTK